MPIADIVTIQITLQTLGAERPGFGQPIVVGEVSAEVAALFTDRTVVVTRTDFAATLVALGFLTTDAIYLEVAQLFAQNPTVVNAVVGRRATPVAQIVNVDVVDTTDGTYSIVINGTSFDFLASSSTAADIVAGLNIAINGGTEPVTGSAGAPDSVDLTADEDGVPFTVSTVSPASGLTTTTPTPNIGIGEDLAAISLELDTWYCVLETSRSQGVIETLAAVIESYSPRRIALGQSNDAPVLAAGTSTDVASVLQAAGFGRTGIVYHDDDLEGAGATFAGDSLPTDPGSITWNNRQVNAITPPDLSSSDIASLQQKSANYLERISGLNITRGGVMANGEFIDVVRGIDWIEANLAADILNLLVQSDKVPYTDEGANTVKGVVEGRLQLAVNQGILASFEVTVPLVADVDPADKAVRNLPDVDFTGVLQGAIHTVEITGTISV